MFIEDFYLSEVLSKASYVRRTDGYPMFTFVPHHVKCVSNRGEVAPGLGFISPHICRYTRLKAASELL